MARSVEIHFGGRGIWVDSNSERRNLQGDRMLLENAEDPPP